MKKSSKSPVTSLAMTHARRSFVILSMKFHGLFGNKSTCDAKQHCHAPFKMKKKVHTNKKWNHKAADTRRFVHESEVKGKHRDNSGAFRLNNNVIRERPATMILLNKNLAASELFLSLVFCLCFSAFFKAATSNNSIY